MTTPSPCGFVHQVPGVIVNMDTPEGIQRCDECDVYPGDLHAAAAVAARFPGAVVRWLDEDGITHTGIDVPADVLLESESNPWVEVDGQPIDFTTTPIPTT